MMKSTHYSPNNLSAEGKIFRHNYGPRYRVPIAFTGEGRTKQSFKDECDINVLMSKYLKTGLMDHVNEALPRFEDVTSLDFQEAQHLIAEAASMFEDIPSAIRNRFDNNPGKLLDWVHDPANAEEAATLGFLDLNKCPPGYGRTSPPVGATGGTSAPAGAAEGHKPPPATPAA
ncbi:MAG: internal scaffolding protein [Microvirus sp.]|nr:MAG: internal scaffolding protein [Microvirus sp.]